MDDVKEEPVLINNKPKKHRRGWFRSFSYWWWGDYESVNDRPDERSVHLKQQCMRQVSLSKLKLKPTETKERKIPDLQPLPKPKLPTINEHKIVDIPPTRPNTPNQAMLSLKQRNQIYGYRTKLEILKNL